MRQKKQAKNRANSENNQSIQANSDQMARPAEFYTDQEFFAQMSANYNDLDDALEAPPTASQQFSNSLVNYLFYYSSLLQGPFDRAAGLAFNYYKSRLPERLQIDDNSQHSFAASSNLTNLASQENASVHKIIDMPAISNAAIRRVSPYFDFSIINAINPFLSEQRQTQTHKVSKRSIGASIRRIGEPESTTVIPQIGVMGGFFRNLLHAKEYEVKHLSMYEFYNSHSYNQHETLGISLSGLNSLYILDDGVVVGITEDMIDPYMFADSMEPSNGGLLYISDNASKGPVLVTDANFIGGYIYAIGKDGRWQQVLDANQKNEFAQAQEIGSNRTPDIFGYFGKMNLDRIRQNNEQGKIDSRHDFLNPAYRDIANYESIKILNSLTQTRYVGGNIVSSGFHHEFSHIAPGDALLFDDGIAMNATSFREAISYNKRHEFADRSNPVLTMQADSNAAIYFANNQGTYDLGLELNSHSQFFSLDGIENEITQNLQGRYQIINQQRQKLDGELQSKLNEAISVRAWMAKELKKQGINPNEKLRLRVSQTIGGLVDDWVYVDPVDLALGWDLYKSKENSELLGLFDGTVSGYRHEDTRKLIAIKNNRSDWLDQHQNQRDKFFNKNSEKLKQRQQLAIESSVLNGATDYSLTQEARQAHRQLVTGSQLGWKDFDSYHLKQYMNNDSRMVIPTIGYAPINNAVFIPSTSFIDNPMQGTLHFINHGLSYEFRHQADVEHFFDNKENVALILNSLSVSGVKQINEILSNGGNTQAKQLAKLFNQDYRIKHFDEIAAESVNNIDTISQSYTEQHSNVIQKTMLQTIKDVLQEEVGAAALFATPVLTYAAYLPGPIGAASRSFLLLAGVSQIAASMEQAISGDSSQERQLGYINLFLAAMHTGKGAAIHYAQPDITFTKFSSGSFYTQDGLRYRLGGLVPSEDGIRFRMIHEGDSGHAFRDVNYFRLTDRVSVELGANAGVYGVSAKQTFTSPEGKQYKFTEITAPTKEGNTASYMIDAGDTYIVTSKYPSRENINEIEVEANHINNIFAVQYAADSGFERLRPGVHGNIIGSDTVQGNFPGSYLNQEGQQIVYDFQFADSQRTTPVINAGNNEYLPVARDGTRSGWRLTREGRYNAPVFYDEAVGAWKVDELNGLPGGVRGEKLFFNLYGKATKFSKLGKLFVDDDTKEHVKQKNDEISRLVNEHAEQRTNDWIVSNIEDAQWVVLNARVESDIDLSMAHEELGNLIKMDENGPLKGPEFRIGEDLVSVYYYSSGEQMYMFEDGPMSILTDQPITQETIDEIRQSAQFIYGYISENKEKMTGGAIGISGFAAALSLGRRNPQLLRAGLRWFRGATAQQDSRALSDTHAGGASSAFRPYGGYPQTHPEILPETREQLHQLIANSGRAHTGILADSETVGYQSFMRRIAANTDTAQLEKNLDRFNSLYGDMKNGEKGAIRVTFYAQRRGDDTGVRPNPERDENIVAVHVGAEILDAEGQVLHGQELVYEDRPIGRKYPVEEGKKHPMKASWLRVGHPGDFGKEFGPDQPGTSKPYFTPYMRIQVDIPELKNALHASFLIDGTTAGPYELDRASCVTCVNFLIAQGGGKPSPTGRLQSWQGLHELAFSDGYYTEVYPEAMRWLYGRKYQNVPVQEALIKGLGAMTFEGKTPNEVLQEAGLIKSSYTPKQSGPDSQQTGLSETGTKPKKSAARDQSNGTGGSNQMQQSESLFQQYGGYPMTKPDELPKNAQELEEFIRQSGPAHSGRAAESQGIGYASFARRIAANTNSEKLLENIERFNSLYGDMPDDVPGAVRITTYMQRRGDDPSARPNSEKDENIVAVHVGSEILNSNGDVLFGQELVYEDRPGGRKYPVEEGKKYPMKASWTRVGHPGKGAPEYGPSQAGTSKPYFTPVMTTVKPISNLKGALQAGYFIDDATAGPYELDRASCVTCVNFVVAQGGGRPSPTGRLQSWVGLYSDALKSGQETYVDQDVMRWLSGRSFSGVPVQEALHKGMGEIIFEGKTPEQVLQEAGLLETGARPKQKQK